MRIAVYRAGQHVGTVSGTGLGDYVVWNGDEELRRAVEAVMRVPASTMTGRVLGGEAQDVGHSFAPGTPGHMKAALTGGALLAYGYIAREEDA